MSPVELRFECQARAPDPAYRPYLSVYVDRRIVSYFAGRSRVLQGGAFTR